MSQPGTFHDVSCRRSIRLHRRGYAQGRSADSRCLGARCSCCAHRFPWSKLAASLQRAKRSQSSGATCRNERRAFVATTQEQFVTAAYVHLDAESEKLHYFRGCASTSLTATRRQVTEITENGLMLARLSFATFTLQFIRFNPVIESSSIQMASSKRQTTRWKNLASLAYRHCSVKARIFHRRRWPTASSQQSRPGQSPRRRPHRARMCIYGRSGLIGKQ